MKKNIFFFLNILILFLSLAQIFTEEKENLTLDESTEININETILGDDSIKSIEIEDIDFGGPLNISDNEMDIVLLCAYLSQQALKNRYPEDIKKISENLGTTSKSVYDKIGTDFLENCINDIDNTTVNKYISNLNYHNNFEWEKKFDEYTKLDYNKYKTLKDIKITVEQKVLLKILEQSNKEFEKRKKEKKMREEKIRQRNEYLKKLKKDQQEKINFGNKKTKGLEIIENISQKYKIIIFIGAILIFFGGIVYFLRKLNSNKKEDNKKKKDKKKKNA